MGDFRDPIPSPIFAVKSAQYPAWIGVIVRRIFTSSALKSRKNDGSAKVLTLFASEISGSDHMAERPLFGSVLHENRNGSVCEHVSSDPTKKKLHKWAMSVGTDR